jgi:hypothetical protein
MADTPQPNLVIRCRNCHHEIAVNPVRAADPAEAGECPSCGYRNVIGVDHPTTRSVSRLPATVRGAIPTST